MSSMVIHVLIKQFEKLSIMMNLPYVKIKVKNLKECTQKMITVVTAISMFNLHSSSSLPTQVEVTPGTQQK